MLYFCDNIGIRINIVIVVIGAGIQVHQFKTPEAAEFFNSLVEEGHRVGAILHSNC